MDKVRIILEARKATLDKDKKHGQPDYMNHQGKPYYYPQNAFNKAQMRTIAAHPDYQQYITTRSGPSAGESKVYVRRDETHPDKLFYMANDQQQHMIRAWVSPHGKLRHHTIYKKSDDKNNRSGWDIVKHVDAEEEKE